MKSENYAVTFDGTDWVVTGEDGRTITLEASPLGTLKFDGIEITIPVPSGAMAGDTFTLNPMAGAAEGISRKITSGQEFAASDSPTGAGNNTNLEAMLKIQDEKLIGKNTLSEAYASLVGTIGDRARSVRSEATSAEIDFTTKYETKQSISGVNMDNERINLDMFMGYYRANAQLLQTATDMFDALLSIR